MDHPGCWCGNRDLRDYSPDYFACDTCSSLVVRKFPDDDLTKVSDQGELYGSGYYTDRLPNTYGFPTLEERARADIPERIMHWLAAVLRYRLPPGRAIDIGAAHGGFVKILNQAGFDAVGLELSPWLSAFASETFGVQMLTGPIESQHLPPASHDVVSVMDVVEHLQDPVSSLKAVADSLTPDGILLVQTPRYLPEQSYSDLIEGGDRFAEHLKSEEHLFLFSRASIRRLLGDAGLLHIEFIPAIFSFYDMFVVASKQPLNTHDEDEVADSLTQAPDRRVALALLDAVSKQKGLEESLHELSLDREARLELIVEQGSEIGRLKSANHDLGQAIAHLKSVNEDLKEEASQLESSFKHAEKAAKALQADLDRERLRYIQTESQLFRTSEVLRMLESLIDGVLASSIYSLVRALGQWDWFASGVEEFRSRKRMDLAGNESPPISDKSSRTGSSQQKPSRLDEAVEVAQAIREPKKIGGIDYGPQTVDHILDGLRDLEVNVEEYQIDVAAFWKYYAAADYDNRHPDYYRFNIVEKALEHHVAADLLDLTERDIYIDIASEHSPVPEIYGRLFSSETFRQDLAYPPGLHGDMIGGDAGAMPIEDDFASAMALHCSFEHFEGDSDIRFVHEAERVLKPGGRVCIVPLYLFDEYAMQTDPAVVGSADVNFESDATVYCLPGWGNTHARFYDPRNLKRRILSNLGRLRPRVLYVPNAHDVDSSCYLRFILHLTKD